MNNSIKSDFRTELAATVLNEIQYQRSNYYYFLGKVDRWNTTDQAPAGAEVDSYIENSLIRENTIFIKRITANDVTLVVNKYDWVTNTVFDFWDNRISMRDLKFYCITDDSNVYKCLDNNGGLPSTVMPTGRSYYAFKTTDGYTWKYMYTVPSFKRLKFTSLLHIPVQRALSDSFYNKGSVDDVVVTSGGSGYVDADLTQIFVTSNDAGTGAILVPVVSRQDVYAENGIDIIRKKGTIVDVKIINGGNGYLVAPTVVVFDSNQTGTGIYGNATAVIKPIIFGGSIKRVTIEDPGENYSFDVATTITIQGDGTGAKLSPVIYNGSVIDVIVENTGTGYSFMILTVSGSGTGAVVNPVLGTSDFMSDQSVVEQTTVSGAIYSIQPTAGGTGYSANTMVNITGNGSGCQASAVIVDGVIKNIVVNSFGQDYTQASVEIIDSSGSGAAAVVIMSPINGHGRDAVEELFGDTLSINSSLQKNILLNKLSQDYRQFGIIKNPTNLVTGQTFRGDSSLIAYEVEFDHVTGLQDQLDLGIEDILSFGENQYRVVDVLNLNVILQQIGTKYVQPIGPMVSNSTNTTYISKSIISQPTVNKYSGKLLYSVNANPFAFTADQGIVVKTYLKF